MLAIICAALAMNVYNGLTYSDWKASLSWFLAGVAFMALPFESLFWRMRSLIDRNFALLKSQNQLIQALGETKADEIAEQFAERLAGMTGSDHSISRITKH